MGLEELSVRLNDRDYINWLKAGRCLLILKAALLPFITQRTRAFHGNILKQDALLKEPCANSACRPRGNTLSSACRACSLWRTVILRHHRQPNTTTVNWGNCYPPHWRTDHWELAKAYMPRGQGKVKVADQCDASALLNLISHCDGFQSVDPKVVTEVIRHRNELMHSCELRVKDEWMRHFRAALKNFLQHFSHVAQMETAGRQMEEMLAADLSMQVSGLDRVDSVDQQETSVDFIGQWEAELLQERLRELLDADNEEEDTKTRDHEQLKRLGGFLQANTDLSERFSAELQVIQSLQARD